MLTGMKYHGIKTTDIVDLSDKYKVLAQRSMVSGN
jgi:hypothetical protein